MTLTIEEIRHLAQFAGMVIKKPSSKEKEDERETEITIARWPSKGVKGDDEEQARHIHVNNGLNDSCKECGKDLRDEVHLRQSELKP